MFVCGLARDSCFSNLTIFQAVRQMQTNEGKRIVRPVSQPDRGHTRVQSASPGINRPNGGARVQAGNPRVTVIRKKPLHKVGYYSLC